MAFFKVLSKHMRETTEGNLEKRQAGFPEYHVENTNQLDRDLWNQDLKAEQATRVKSVTVSPVW